MGDTNQASQARRPRTAVLGNVAGMERHLRGWPDMWRLAGLASRKRPPSAPHLPAKLGARDRVRLVITAYQAGLFDT